MLEEQVQLAPYFGCLTTPTVNSTDCLGSEEPLRPW